MGRNVLGPAPGQRSGVRGPGGACAAPLGKDLRPVLPGQVRRQNRAVAHRMRRVLQGFTTIDRLRACGRVPVNAVNGGAVIRGTETAEGVQAGVAGVARCGSPWACPVCARRIAAQRASDIAQVLQRTADQGGSAALLTLTSRHGRKDSLEEMWEAISRAWASVTSGRGWVADRDLFGVRGTIRTVEYTHSEDNGHHLHVHACILFEQPLSPEMMEEFGHRCFGRWARALQRRGFDAVAEKGGLDVRPIRMTADSIEQVAEYVSKAAFEVSGGVSKRGRCSMAGQDGHDCSKAPCSKKSRSAFEILADAVQGE